MFGFAAALFLVLVAAAVVLAAEAKSGRLVGRTPGRTRARAAFFLAATVAGGSLLAALPASEWVFALALAPITLVSLARWAMLAHARWRGWRLGLATLVLVGTGVAACRALLPLPLSRAALVEGLQPGRQARYPDTIAPEASHPVRM